MSDQIEMSRLLSENLGSEPGGYQWRVTLDTTKGSVQFHWSESKTGKQVGEGQVVYTDLHELTWSIRCPPNAQEDSFTSEHLNSIRAALNRLNKRFPADLNTFAIHRVSAEPGKKTAVHEELRFEPGHRPWYWLEKQIQRMAFASRIAFSPWAKTSAAVEGLDLEDKELDRFDTWFLRQQRREAEERERLQQNMARMAIERKQREERRAEQRRLFALRQAEQAAAASRTPAQPPARPLPALPVHFELPPLQLQETILPLSDLRGYLLRERAAQWWVTNQSDDLLCLPYCRIEKLEYQIRTALRVLGPLRGRALLSDEVGLGKTIEAGLVLKELLTRGMVKKFLVLTVPSLVDQWEEELQDKFGLSTVTTNHASARGDATQFWRENPGIVASLHTLKQPSNLELARQVQWNILIVDEAHYLRNRDSQAWRAVNALPRQFLLLLTATPVQNSIEELYHLVTLLQPGQLPTPKDFRAQFMDPKRPRQPRRPEELRRLLGQVMIRNTRANSGVNLPPRGAETVIFEPSEAEQKFWHAWELEFRAALTRLNASQSNLWGRLLLQAAGSSPAAWRGALEKFPDRVSARGWSEEAPLEDSWKRKCELLQPLTRGEGGAVVFTQFLATQSALAEAMEKADVPTFVVNGSTPAQARQPIVEEFRRSGGALLLTHSGTEGRNLQFSHRLANFDLPWNPMEIEQRIGRLHRLGQRHPVRIYNFVQAGTLQEHLLQILQEKLNLFELVVGETGLVLGERFSSDEFAEEILRRWKENEGRVAEAIAGLGEELAAARDEYQEVKKLDETLFAKDYEST